MGLEVAAVNLLPPLLQSHLQRQFPVRARRAGRAGRRDGGQPDAVPLPVRARPGHRRSIGKHACVLVCAPCLRARWRRDTGCAEERNPLRLETKAAESHGPRSRRRAPPRGGPRAPQSTALSPVASVCGHAAPCSRGPVSLCTCALVFRTRAGHRGMGGQQRAWTTRPASTSGHG